MKPKIIAQDKIHLRQLIEKEMGQHGIDCDLNHIDVSNVTNMSDLFFESKFNGSISQ